LLLMEEGEELIFGKNAVLAFLERATDGQPVDILKAGAPAEEVLPALAEQRSQVPEQRQVSPDVKRLNRLSRVRLNKILIATGVRPDRRLERIQELARKQKVPVHSCDRKKLDQLAGPERRHQGVLAMVSPAEIWQLDDLLQKVELDRTALELSGQSLDGYMVAVLDGIEDPHNLGACIRVAEAAGVNGLLIPQRRAAGLTGVVAKISAGAVASLPVVRVSNLVQSIETLKKYGFWVVGLDAGARQLYTEVDLRRPLAVVIGGEGKGIGRLVREHCDFLVKIPMLGKTESLNASVAAGIFFYEVVRQSGISNNS